MRRLLTGMLSFAALATLTVAVRGQAPSRDDILQDIAAKRAELQRLEDQFLAPAEKDRTAYREFLSQPYTGLMRLLPRERYESESYKKNQKTLTIRGAGAYFSFARESHEYGYGSDLELDSGYLSVGFAGACYGMMIDLGDVPLDEVTTDYAGVLSLLNYAAAKDEPEARGEQRLVQRGRILDGATYKARLPVKIGSTFLLRSVNYDYSDVLVGFRPVRQDSDGSVIIAWKLLKRFPKPELVRNLRVDN